MDALPQITPEAIDHEDSKRDASMLLDAMLENLHLNVDFLVFSHQNRHNLIQKLFFL